jgi:membrane protein
MIGLWSRGGLSWRELFKRTWREAWEDEVFGTAARLAFYHFLALFPSLLLLLMLLAALDGAGSALEKALVSALDKVLPSEAAGLITSTMKDFGNTAVRGSAAWTAVLGAVWAALNGTWALIAGLNRAYEVKDERRWWVLLLVMLALTLALGIATMAALAAIFYGGEAGQALHVGAVWNWIHWPVVIVLLLVAFALLYRFGPHLYDLELKWSTPGAVVGVALWLVATLLFRFYVNHFGSYGRIYGRLAAVAVLLLWLYFTGAAILIGGELNSEIENAAAEGGDPEARRPGQKRPGEG